jgi:hypothetical protein
MPLQKLQFKPGIVRDTTDYTNEGGWFDCDKIRFRMGLPETIGGWARFTNSTMLGTCRSLHVWNTLSGIAYVGAGTSRKFYAIEGSEPADITPIRLVTTGAATFAAVDGSSTLTVTDASNNVYLGDFVTFSAAVSLGGNITALVLNQEYEVTNIVDANTYTIEATATANSSDTGNGGASVVATYQINIGLDTVVLGAGWGAGVWSRGTWSSAADITIPGSSLRLWSQDNFGEDLVFNVRTGGIFYWDASNGTSNRGVNIVDLAGANSAPVIANQVIVSERDRHVIAFGCNPEFDSAGSPTTTQDPLVIRFSSQESVTDWETRADNTAGELRIGTGSYIVGATQTKQQVVIFTDLSVYTMQYIGPPYTYGLTEVSSNISIVGQNAMSSTGDSVYWMGVGQFYMYNGSVSQIPCTVREYVFSNINQFQLSKVAAANNAAFSEIWWFYPSAASDNNDRYVVYNYAADIWYYGTMARTAWEDNGYTGLPIAASQDGYLYYQEYGLNDNSGDLPVPLNAYIESSAIDIGEGEQFMFASRIIPDITFRNSTTDPTATFTIKARNYPGGSYFNTSNNSVVSTATVPVQLFTEQAFIRVRGRSVALRVESDQVDTAWRLGSPRLEIRPDGRR